MKLGILSDSHGKVDITRRAVELLQAAGATTFVHCGDVGDTRVLDVLIGLDAHFVFGNNDWDHAALFRYGDAHNHMCMGVSGAIEWEGRRVAVTHGDDAREVARITRPENHASYLLTGHTHVRHDRRVGVIRWINPGALYRATVKSVAVLDLATDVLEFIDVPDKSRE